MRKGTKFTEEHKRKIGLAHKGMKLSDITKQKISNAHKGKKHPISEETRKKISQSHIGLKHSKESIEKMKLKKSSKETITKSVNTRKLRGSYRKLSTEERIKRKQNALKGDKHYNWKGGLTPINFKIRNSLEYKLWREAVFERDDWTCLWCRQKGGNLNADHIKPFAYFPELRFAIDNGRTLCVDCHRKTDTWGGRKVIS